MDNETFMWNDIKSCIFENGSLFENTSMQSCNETQEETISSIRPQQVIAVVFGIFGICGNVISLFAIIKMGSKSLSANLRLVISLCFSDILTSIGVIMYLCIEHNLLNTQPEHLSYNNLMCVSVALRCFRMFAHIISLFNLGGLALDNYSSLVRPLQYAVTPINNKATRIISLFWIIAFLLGFSKFLLPVALPSYCQSSPDIAFCETVYCSQYDSEYIVFFLTFISLFGILGTYIIIFRKLRGPFVNHEMYRQQRRNRRGILTTVLIVVTFMVCWLPYCLFELTITLKIRYFFDLNFMVRDFRLIRTVDLYLYDLLLLNSILDPLIYAKRLTEVRTGYRFLRKCLVECNENNEGFGSNLVSTQLLLKENISNAQSRKASQSTTRSSFLRQ